ncbi:predicted protein [Sclerotinia sclerotiorum 1980 UF-70]|uniref:Uncharacterized protein n=1 Tax=Sclerotinia sclerotiorum (strain ATCC 18683 / 1980 / Ss-1) TaxID=665079 RepID=A7EXG6_SCLS1|nr:predicted protein [Sclerotinia sclerotiorum 1980 UF-70]EDN94158.1 predicted protein [Sclerotinia sclerotiorum 1980 UF-70]
MVFGDNYHTSMLGHHSKVGVISIYVCMNECLLERKLKSDIAEPQIWVDSETRRKVVL